MRVVSVCGAGAYLAREGARGAAARLRFRAGVARVGVFGAGSERREGEGGCA